MTVKRYDLGREILAYSGVSTMGIVECPGGKYVRHDEYESMRTALDAIIKDLEMRSEWKSGSQHKVVDCGNGVYLNAKRVLGQT